MLKTHSTSKTPNNRPLTPKQGKYLTWAQRKLLQSSLQENLSQFHRHRIKIMLMADEGYTQTQICRELGCSQETARHWATIAKMGQVNTWRESSVGRPKTIDQSHLDLLKTLVNYSPRDYGYGFDRWTFKWLSHYLSRHLGIKISTRHLSSILKSAGISIRNKVKK